MRFFKLASTQARPYSYPVIRTVSNVKDASVRVVLLCPHFIGVPFLVVIVTLGVDKSSYGGEN